LSLIKAGGANSLSKWPWALDQQEAIMQDSTSAGGGKQTSLFNPFLDLAVAGLETQLKAWQTYQVEGTRFVARRMHTNLEHLRALGHCCDAHSIGECQRAWLSNMQKDYAEECARITATTFATGFGDLAGLGWLFGERPAKEIPQVQTDTGSQQPAPLESQPGYAAAA
jgi:hypothetical protein